MVIEDAMTPPKIRPPPFPLNVIFIPVAPPALNLNVVADRRIKNKDQLRKPGLS
jgi:hypothetical protein